MQRLALFRLVGKFRRRQLAQLAVLRGVVPQFGCAVARDDGCFISAVLFDDGGERFALLHQRGIGFLILVNFGVCQALLQFVKARLGFFELFDHV